MVQEAVRSCRTGMSNVIFEKLPACSTSHPSVVQTSQALFMLFAWRRRMHAAVGQGPLMGPIEELHVRDLQEILEQMSQGGADDVQLIDVREDFEHQTASLPGFKLMPMSRQAFASFWQGSKHSVLMFH